MLGCDGARGREDTRQPVGDVSRYDLLDVRGGFVAYCVSHMPKGCLTDHCEIVGFQILKLGAGMGRNDQISNLHLKIDPLLSLRGVRIVRIPHLNGRGQNLGFDEC